MTLAACVLLMSISGCSRPSSGLPVAAHVSVSGVVQGALDTIADAEVRLYAVDPNDSAADANIEMAAPVRSDQHGGFEFASLLACPADDAVIYLEATGGVPAVTGIANPAIGLLNVLGTCSSLAPQIVATINERTTVGSAWPLAAYATRSGQFLPKTGQARQFLAAVATIGKLVDSDGGATPGRLLAPDEAAPVAAINSLANAIASCIVTDGGSAGDSTPCGRLFALAAESGAARPSDTLSAALQIGANPARDVRNLYALTAERSIFVPSLAAAPGDWSLATTLLGATPVVAMTNASTTDKGKGSAASSSSTSITPSTSGSVRLTAEDAPLVANTIVITTGGTYQGDWVSTDPTVAAVTVQTDQPVIIQNSTVTGRGNLIVATGSNGANLTVQNVTGTGLDPLVAGKARGAFLVAYIANSLTVQNCTMTGTRFGVKLGFSTAASVHILNNQAINLEDRASDGNGGFQTTRPQLGHFVYFYQVTAASGAEIGWNQMVQTMGQSSVDNAIELYKSRGAFGTPILVHDNYVEGMSSPAVTTYLASGLAATGDSTATESAYIHLFSNEVVHTAGSGLTISNGHDITAQTNRVVSCGQSGSGSWYSKAGVDAIILWNHSASPNFYNNVITSTAGGLIVPNAAGNPASADTSANPVDLQTASNSISGNLFTDPCLTGGVLTLSAEDTERAYWANKLATNNQTIGDQHGPVTVTVSPAATTLVQGQTQQLTATTTWASNTGVTWSLSSGTGTISTSGLYTAPSPVASAQTVTVTATSLQDTTKTGVATLTVTPPISVSVTPATASLGLSQTQQLTATVANAANSAVTWSLSTAVGSISASGLYTAPPTLTSTTSVTATATSVADATKTASATLTVIPPPVIVSPGPVSLYAGQTQQFSAVVQGTTNQAVTWAMSPSVGTLSASGLYTAPASITGSQTITVTAYSAAISQYTNVRVTLLPPVKVNLYSSYFTDTVNQTSQFSAQVLNTTNTAVTWSISPTVGAVSTTGLYTAPASITTQQTITFTATSVADPTKSASGTVVLNPPVAVTMSPAAVTLLPAATQQFNAYVAWNSNTSVTWSLSPALGSVSSAGLYTAPSNTSVVQSVTLTATSVADPTRSAAAAITLNPPVSVSITPSSATVTLNGSQLYAATVLNTSNTGVTWSISPALGSISSGGRYTPPSTAVTSPQTVTVTATSVVDTTKSATATVIVNPPVAVSVTPASSTLYASQTQQLTPAVLWTTNTAVVYSLSPAVGSISSTGLYTAPASITATQSVTVTVDSAADGSQYALAHITLLPPVKVNLYSSYFTDSVNQTSQFTAQVLNTSNTAVTWSISPATGSISASGLYTAPASITAQQTVMVTATSVADPTRFATGGVTLNPPVSVAVIPGSVTLTTSHTQQFTAAVAWANNTAVTWSISPSSGTLTSAGLYTAPATINANSTVLVTATSVADPTKSGTATVNLLTLVGPAPITITEGGTYSGNWISNDPAVAAVTVNTDAPVIIQNSTVQGRNQLILVNGINGANVTVQNVTGTGLDPQVAGQERGAFLAGYTMQSLVVTNNTMSGVSFGVKLGTSPALTSLSILNNVATQLEDRASDGAGGLTTNRPQFGHFIGFYNVTAPNGGEIGWNQMVQTIGTSSTEDAINIYNSQGASGFPLRVHDNYLEGYSSSTTGTYTGNGLITDGDSSGITAYVVFQANEMVHTAGGGVALASGHDNSAVANRVVSCGQDASGNWYSRAGVSAVTLWNYYGAANFDNNSITSTAGGIVSPDANGLPVVTDSVTLGSDGSSTNSGNLFTDPCLVNGVLSLAAEDAERSFWANKLKTNSITLGDQH